jgi:hypothetical protein
MRYLPEIRHCGRQNAGFGAWERGYQPFNQGFLATRKPTLSYELTGELPLRHEERTPSVP